MFVVFDFDGVIIDSSPLIELGVVNIFRRLGIEPPEGEHLVWMGPSIEVSVRRLRETHSLPEGHQAELEMAYFEGIAMGPDGLVSYCEGMEKVLSDLKAAKVPMAMATMKSHFEMESISKVTGKYPPLPGLEHFDIVCAPVDHRGSSKKQMVAQAIERIHDCNPPDLGRGTASEAKVGVMIGDRGSDMEAGRSHGLFPVGVLWGAGSREELMASGAEMVVENTDELREVLGRCGVPLSAEQ